MIGLCFEAETTCSSCGKPLPMNAVTETIVCSECLHTNTFTVDEWKKLLADMLREGPNYNENEGTPSTIMGARTYKITYVRQNPKFLDTKTYMDIASFTSIISHGTVVNPESNIAYSVRCVPENLKNACPGVTHLICEDFTQIPNYSGSSEVLDRKPQGELIPFTCPNCAGTLQIDGSERLLKCKFCDTESFIPDETWQKIHPVKTKQRFYFWFDENSVVFDWDMDLYDIVADDDGTLYLSVSPLYDRSEDDLWLVALKPDLTVKWRRDKLNFKTNSSDKKPRLGLNKDNELMVWSGDRNMMLMLSKTDGSEIRRMGKKCEGRDKQNNTKMDFIQCKFIAADIDGNYFTLVDRDKQNSESDRYYEFMVMDKDTNLHKPWSEEETQSKGFFGSLKKAISGSIKIAHLKDLKDKVINCLDNDLKISVGADGSYYFFKSSLVSKYDRTGKQIYLKEISGGYISHKVIGDKEGNGYFIFSASEKSKTSLIKISSDGSTMTTLVKHVIDGGDLGKENMLAISTDGAFYCAGFAGRLRVYDSNGKLQYASFKSLKDEKKITTKIKEMEG